MVMGRRWVDSKKAVAPCSWHMQALVGLMFTLAFLAASSESCKVDHCWHQARETMAAQRIIEGPNLAYCQVLETQMMCMRAAARRCRGNLQFHTMESLTTKQHDKNNCSRVTILPGSYRNETTAVLPMPPAGRPKACSYHGVADHQQCALFGDPHLRTFDGEYQTCKVVGAWPLVDNAYLAVQVTNDAVLPGTSAATATSKVTVIIKDGNNQCSRSKTYEAQVGNLPLAFVDGTHHSGPDRSVRVRTKSPNGHVEISIRYISTTIVVRQVGNFLTVAIKMPREVVPQGVAGDGVQLCTKGCPASERIDYVPFLWGDSRGTQTQFGSVEGFSREAALDKCRAENLTDFYLDSCVFDLMMTGDATFGQAATKAMHDLKSLTQNLYLKLPNRTELPTLAPAVAVLSPDPSSVAGVDRGAPGRTVALQSTPSVVVAAALCFLMLWLGRSGS